MNACSASYQSGTYIRQGELLPRGAVPQDLVHCGQQRANVLLFALRPLLNLHPAGVEVGWHRTPLNDKP